MKILVLLCMVNLAHAGPLSQYLKPLKAKDHLTEPHNSSFIIGGRPAYNGEAPYQVALNVGSNFCGGSIISDRWILTAAHCVDDYFPNSINVRYSTIIRNNGGFTASIFSIHVHWSYNKVTVDNDIALLRTISSLRLGEMGFAEAIPLSYSDIISSEYLVVSGWGRTQVNDNTLPDALQIVEVQTMDQYSCRQIYGNGITNNMLCAYSQCKNSCSGDSGGPAALNSYPKELVRIVSWGSGCGVNPGVYTRVSRYRDWISVTMRLYG